MGLFKKIFPSHNDRQVNKIKKIVKEIVLLEEEFKAKSDEELRACTQIYIDEYNAAVSKDEGKSDKVKSEALDKLLPRAFATVREASGRVLGMRHYEEQLIGGVVLYQGRIAEMRTGEGKTLVATLAAYLKAIPKKGVHVVTVNEYLAKRDAEWMGKIYRFLGLSVGVIYSGMNYEDKKSAYGCDITYCTNSEVGFDYLRDNMVKDVSQRVQRSLEFAIVDEVDSILVDEARTPLIISGKGDKPNDEEYIRADTFVKTLIPPQEDEEQEDVENADGDTENGESREDTQEEQEESEQAQEVLQADFEYVKKDKSVFLNELGAQKADEFYGIEGLFGAASEEEAQSRQEGLDGEDSAEDEYQRIKRQQSIKHYVDNALKANYIMQEGINYIVVDRQIIIIDEFTGRQMIGRRFSDGLHQAIEAKEGVPIKNENKTMATITFQNFFRLYKSLSGMTGTAKTEENEFESIYGLDVVAIPTHKKVIRVDEPDRLYKTQNGKYNAILEDIKTHHAKKQPLLIGTISVEKSEDLSDMLKKINIPHKVLNAKNHEKEAEFIAQAGKLGAVTIATNMAGRGTDILLGGNPEFVAKQRLEASLKKKEKYTPELMEQAVSYAHTDDSEVLAAREEYKKYYDEEAQITEKDRVDVIKNGGLRVIGTERNEARRIDNQLRGRSGRQGDPGSSVFYMSLEDDMVKAFGGEQADKLKDFLSIDEDTPIVSKLVTRMFESVQNRVEDRNFSVRKHVLGYDDVMNTQRSIIYEQRNVVLDGMDVHQQILAMMQSVIADICNAYVNYKEDHRDWNYDGFNKDLEECVLASGTNLLTASYIESLADNSIGGLADGIFEVAKEQYETKSREIDALIDERNAIVQTHCGEVYNFGFIERFTMLQTVDEKWMNHIDEMDQLKQGIGLVAYAQRDPVMQYKIEGFDMFEKMVKSIQYEAVQKLVKTDFQSNLQEQIKEINDERARRIQMTTNENRNADGGRTRAKGKVIKNNARAQVKGQTMVRAEKKINGNSPCPCGSGKKYKFCCQNKDGKKSIYTSK